MRTRTRPPAVLFDAAGTLIELREPLGQSYARLAARHGFDVEPEALARAFASAHGSAPPMVFPGAGPGPTAALERMWGRDVVRRTFEAATRGQSGGALDACFDALWRHFARPEAWRRAPGARAALTRLRAEGRVLGVVSNFDQRLPSILEGLELAEFFDVVVIPARAGAAKPDPRIFVFALDSLGLAAADAIYVGDDREHDIEGARAAGMRAVDARSLATLEELPNHLTTEPR